MPTTWKSPHVTPPTVCSPSTTSQLQSWIRIPPHWGGSDSATPPRQSSGTAAVVEDGPVRLVPLLGDRCAGGCSGFVRARNAHGDHEGQHGAQPDRHVTDGMARGVAPVTTRPGAVIRWAAPGSRRTPPRSRAAPPGPGSSDRGVCGSIPWRVRAPRGSALGVSPACVARSSCSSIICCRRSATSSSRTSFSSSSRSKAMSIRDPSTPDPSIAQLDSYLNEMFTRAR